MVKTDPSDTVETQSLRLPPSSGPGSGKDAWMAVARDVLDANENLARIMEEQRKTIRDLEAEIGLLREQISKRKPKGGRSRITDDRVNRIERALEAGQKTRAIATQFGVSAMTVSRIGQRMRARTAQSA